MAYAIRKQIRDAVAAALDGLPTTGMNVFENRLHELQDDELPALRIYTNDESISIASLGQFRRRQHSLDVVVECCSKKSDGMDDELDAMVREVIERLDANQGAGGAKMIEPRRIETDMEAEAERDVGVARITFEAPYYTAMATLDVAL
jgi:hypothetical protein